MNGMKIFTWIQRYWKILTFLLVIIGIVGFTLYRKTQTNQVELTFVQPEKRDLTKTLDISGVVTADEYVRLRFAAGGKVVWLGAQEGDWVKKWQTIATIDQRELQKRLEKDLNLYMKERWDWNQTLDNTKDRWLPKEEERTKDKEQWDLDNTVLDVEIRDIAISNTRLTSPIEGVLISSPTNVTGVQLASTDAFEVVNPETLLFQARVDEVDIANVQASQSAIIELDAYPDKTFKSFVKSIAYKSSQTDTGTVFLVDLPLTLDDLNTLRLGMNGDASIILDTRDDVLSIPFESTIQRDDKVYAQVQSGENQTEERNIEVGLETEDYVEILSGLDENDNVLLPE